MRTSVDRAPEPRRSDAEPKHATTQAGTPSSDAARYVLSAVRVAVGRSHNAALAAAARDLASRVHDPAHQETLDETQLDEVIELPPMAITAEPPRATPQVPAPAPAVSLAVDPQTEASRPRPTFPGDDAALDDTNADADVSGRLRALASRLDKLRATSADGHDLRVPDTWILAEVLAELLDLMGGEPGAADAAREVDNDATPRVDRDAQLGKQPRPPVEHDAARPGDPGRNASKTPRPDKAIAESEVRAMTERNQSYERSMKRGPVKLGPKQKPKLTDKDLTLPPDPSEATKKLGAKVPSAKGVAAKGSAAVSIEQATGGESTGGAAVAAWKGKIDAKTGAISAKEVEPVPDRSRYVVTIREATAKQEPQSKQTKLELLAKAREEVPPVSNYLPDGLDLPGDPLPAARKKVDDLIDLRIDEQKPPPLVRSPIDSVPVLGHLVSKPDDFGVVHVYKKIKPNRYGEIHVLGPGDKEPRGGPFDETRREKPVEGEGPLKDRIRAHNAKEPRNVKPPATQRALGGKDRSNEDLPLAAPEVPTIEGIKQVDPAAILEAALAGAKDGASRILEATKVAFPGYKALPNDYLDPWHPEVHRDVLREIDTIRVNGKIASKTLDEKLGAERDKIEQQVTTSHEVVNEVKKDGVTEFRTTHEKIGDFISGVKDDLDRQAEEQAALAKGGYDSDEMKQLRATRDRYIKNNDDKVELWLERYAQQRDSRKAKLTEFEQEQIMAYKACAELDRQTIKKRAPAGWEKDEAKKKEVDDAIKEIEVWEKLITSTGQLKDGTLGVKKHFDKLRTQVDAQVDGWDRALKQAGEAYDEQAEKWYRKQLGLEQGILDKIVNALLEWLGVAKKKSKEWKRKSDADNRAYLKAGQNDLAKLIVEHGKDLGDKKVESIKGLSESQKAIAESFYKGKGGKKGDSAAALAAGLMAQLGEQWRPRLHQRLEAKVLNGDAQTIVKVADRMSGVRIAEVVNSLKKSFEGTGTKDKEGLIYGKLAGLSRIQVRAVEIVYETEVGSPLRADMHSELYDLGEIIYGSQHDWQRGRELLEGGRSVAETQAVNQALIESEVIALNQSMDAAFLGGGFGTQEADLLKHLRGKSPAEIEALKAAYKERYGKDLVAHIKSELLDGVSAPYQWEEALALLENRPEDAEAAALRGSMGHVRVGEKSYVFLGAGAAALGGPLLGMLSPALGPATHFGGKKLDLPLDDDAILNKITREPKEAEDALMRVRKQLDQEAAAGGWSDEMYREQLALRFKKIDDVFGTKYGGSVGANDLRRSPLEQAFANAFPRDTAIMLTGILRQDLAMESAGRIGAEIMPVPGRSEGINKALFDQYKRQYEAEHRDVEIEWQKKKEEERIKCTVLLRDPKTGEVMLDEHGREKVDEKATRLKLQDWGKRWLSERGKDDRRVEMEEEAERRAREKAPKNMGKLIQFYEDPKNGFTSALWSKGSFEADVYAATNVSWGGIKQLVGYEDRTAATDKTLKLLEQGGYLSDGQRLFYAVYGVGTDEQTVDEVYEGKSKRQIDRAHAQLKTAMGEANVKTSMTPEQWVKDDFSGRELDDIDEKQYGIPVTIEDRVARADRQLAREKRSREGGAGVLDYALGVGIGSMLLGPIAGPVVGAGLVGTLGELRSSMAAKEMAMFEREVAALKEVQSEIERKKLELAQKDIVEGDPAFYEAMQPLYDKAALMTRSVDAALAAHRNKIDAIADWATSAIQAVMIVGGVIIMAVVSAVLEVGTAGGATPAVAAAWAALITALVTSTATIGAKIIIKGGAYGWEELAGDVAMAAVEAIMAAATANISTGLLKSGSLLSKLAAKGKVGEFIAEGLAGIFEGVVQGIPGAFLGSAIQGDLSLDAILGQIGQSAGMAGMMHMAKPMLNPVLGRLGNAITKRIGPRPTAEIASYRSSQANMDETFKQYQKEHPSASRHELLRQLDEAMLARHQTAFGDPSTQAILRRDLLDGLPGPVRQHYAGAKIEMLTDAEFTKKFGSSNDAHVVTRNGEPVVVVRAGTDLGGLGSKSPHIFEGPATPRPHPATGTPEPVTPKARPTAAASEPPAAPARPHVEAPEIELAGGEAQELPQHVIMEPYSGPSLDSALDIARKNPGAKVIATESSYHPPADDVSKFKAAGHEYHGDNQPAAVPHNSVDEIKMRFPLSDVEAARVTFMDHLARVRAEHPDMPSVQQAELAMKRVETVTNHGLYALERLKPGGVMEVVYWEREIGGEISKLQERTYKDPVSGKTYRFQVESTQMLPKSQVAPHSGWNVPLKSPHDPVHVVVVRKIEVDVEISSTKRSTPESVDAPPTKRSTHPEIETEMAESRRRPPAAEPTPVPAEGPIARIREHEAPLGSRAEAAAQAEKGRCAAWVWVEIMRNIGWVGAVADQPGWHPSVDKKGHGFGDIVRAIRDPSGNKLPRITGHPSELIASAQTMKPGTQIIISAKTKNGVWHAMLGVVQADGSLELTHVNRASSVKEELSQFKKTGDAVAPGERVRADLTPDPAGNVLVTTRIYDAQVPELANFTNHRWWVLPDLQGPGKLPKIKSDAVDIHKLLPEGQRLPARVRKAIEADLIEVGHTRNSLRDLDDNALLAAHNKAQAELAPKRIAEFRETLPWHAKGELDSLVGDTGLHHKPITPETQARLGKALGTPIHVDPELNPGEIRVKYQVGKLGNITGLEIHLGPGATLGDALLHVGTLHSFKRYQGVTGVLRNVTDSIGRLIGSGKLPMNSRAHEAWRELQKLPAIVRSKKLLIESGTLDIHTRVKLEMEIESLERQIAKHVGELGDVTTRGRGYVASEGTLVQIDAPLGEQELRPGYIDKVKRGLYTGIDPTKPIPGIASETNRFPLRSGATQYHTELDASPAPKEPPFILGKLVSTFDPANAHLTMHDHFLHQEMPSPITHKGGLIPRKGTPTIVYSNLRQMREMGIGFGELKRLTLENLQNLESIMMIHNTKNSPIELARVLQQTPVMLYIRTTMRQSGHDMFDIKLVRSPKTKLVNLERLIGHFSTGIGGIGPGLVNPELARPLYLEIAKRLNVPLTSEVEIGYNVEISLKPSAP